MEDGLASLLARLQGLAGAGEDARLKAQEAEQLQSSCSAICASAKGRSLTAGQHQELWQAAGLLWNASIDADAADADTAAALKQCACDLCGLLPSEALPAAQLAQAASFCRDAGRAWAALGRHEAAEAVLAKGMERGQALQDVCFDRGGWGPRQEAAAELLFDLLAGRLRTALHLGGGQQLLAGALTQQARQLAGDSRLPARASAASRLQLVGLLKAHAMRLLQARAAPAYVRGVQFYPIDSLGAPSTPPPVQDDKAEQACGLLGTAYEVLMEVESEGSAAAGEPELPAMACALLCLMAHASVASGQPERALSCVQAVQQMGDRWATQVTVPYLSQQALLLLGRPDEAESELQNVVNHEEAGTDICTAAITAALQSPGGLDSARSALTVAMERFPEEPGLAVEVVQAALAAGEAAPPAADALALEVAGDERLQEALGEEPALRTRLHGLLWNQAVARLGAEAYAPALELLRASAPLAPAPEQRLACWRSQALCALGAGQHAEALQYLDAAEALEPGATSTALLRLKVQLAAGDEAGAAAAVAALAGGGGGGAPDLLRVACCEAVAAGAPAAARLALERLLQCLARDPEACAGSPAGYEGAVFQNLIQLVLAQPAAPPAPAPAAPTGAPAGGAGGQQGGGECGESSWAGEWSAGGGGGGSGGGEGASRARSAELARVVDAAVDRMQAVGPAAFFAAADGRPAQHEWFALTAWNAALEAGAAGHAQQAAALLSSCGDLLAALPDADLQSLQARRAARGGAGSRRRFPGAGRCRTAYLMAAAAAADVAAATADRPEQQELCLALAERRLEAAQAAGAACRELQLLGAAGAGGEEGKADVFHMLLQFVVATHRGDAAAQLAVIEEARGHPAVTAAHFLRMAAALGPAGPPAAHDAARREEGQGGAGQVARAAQLAAYERVASATPIDYGLLAAILRSLVEAAPSNAERLAHLEDAAGMLDAAPAGSYPPAELRWLLSFAWNRGATHARFLRHEEALRYQRWACNALRHDPEFAEQHQEAMQHQLQRTVEAARVAAGGEPATGAGAMDVEAA
eukprot:scaffold3.g6618.t1